MTDDALRTYVSGDFSSLSFPPCFSASNKLLSITEGRSSWLSLEAETAKVALYTTHALVCDQDDVST